MDPFQAQSYYVMQQDVSRQTLHNNFLLCWSNDFVMYKLVCELTDGSGVSLEGKPYGVMKKMLHRS